MSETNVLRSFVKKVSPAPIARLARRLLLWQQRSQFRPYKVTKIIQGESFPFYIADNTAELWYRGDEGSVYEELAFIRDRMLSPSDLVFDVGSHHGLHTICMARHSARVVAIEPNPHNLLVLEKNVRLNRLNNVTLCQTAVGDSRGKITLLEDSNQGGVLPGRVGSLPTRHVKLQTLDTIAHDHGFPQLLKIDVEGFEAAALRGASEILRTRPKIAIEIHVDWVVRYGSSVNEVIDLLNPSSYRIWVLPFSSELKRWGGENFTAYPPPKFMLFLIP